MSYNLQKCNNSALISVFMIICIFGVLGHFKVKLGNYLPDMEKVNKVPQTAIVKPEISAKKHVN